MKILLPPESQQPPLYCHAADDGSEKSHCGVLQKEQAIAGKKSRIMVFVPSEFVLTLEVKLPSGNRRELLKALPYLVEEQLADDLHSVIISHEKLRPGQKIVCWVVSQSLMQQWAEQLAELGISTYQCFPDFCLLPVPEAAQSVELLLGQRLLQRSGIYRGYAIHADSAAAFTALKEQQSEHKAGNRLEWADAQELLQQQPAVWPDFSLRIPPSAQSKAAHSGARWWPAVAVLLLAILLYTASELWAIHALNARQQQTEAQIESLFFSTFPHIKRLQDAEFQATQALRQLQGGSSNKPSLFFSVFYPLADFLRQHRDMRISSLQFRNAQLRVQVEAANLASIEALQKAISKQTGQPVKLLSASRKGKAMSGRLLIGEAS
ncbi:MAG: hypothetical protein KZQ58_05760 [gamma proteobacterium symbiont of Bathyaustriella thionipta]|nr:hypothetical protein [gamma proteobacterium symbiont of Bathyaustriella thionipta]